MSIQIKLKDQTCFGDLLFSGTLELSEGFVSVKELIEMRVALQLQYLDRQVNSDCNNGGYTAPTASDMSILSGKLENVDLRKREAVDLFSRGSILLFVDDEQKTDLNDLVYVSSNTEVVFVRLVQIVGG